MTTPIVIDCDPGHDDAFALMLAVASPELDLVGVTTVAGNQTLEKTTANALRILELCGRGDVPVAEGAADPLVRARDVAAHVHGETGLDGPDLPPPAGEPVTEHAVDFLARVIREREGALTLVPTGPLTNVALLLAMRPDARPERIVLMGGSIGEGNRTPAAEFNIWADPEAARRVFESGIEMTMIGLDVTHQALVTDADADELRGAGRVGKVAAELLDFYRLWHRALLSRSRRLAAPRPRRRRARDRPDARRDEAGPHRGRLRLGAGQRAHERRLAREPPERQAAERHRGPRHRQPALRRADQAAHHVPRLTRRKGAAASRRGRGMAQARARRSTRTARPRPKTPSRVKKRRAKRPRSAHHDAELIGLGFVAVGVFFAAVLWFGLSGGPVPDAAASASGWAAYLLPAVFVPVGLLMVTRSSLVAVGPFKLGLGLTIAGFLIALGSAHGGWAGRHLESVLAPGIGVTGSTILGVMLALVGVLFLTGASLGALLRRSGHAVHQRLEERPPAGAPHGQAKAGADARARLELLPPAPEA